MKVCKMGLESIWIDHAQGNVRLCAWAGYWLGNLQENTIEELWYGNKADIFRQSMLDGSYRFCSSATCPYLANGNLDMMLVDYIVPEYPKFCSLSYEEQCNYVCTFCRKEHYYAGKNEREQINRIEHEVKKFIGQLHTISANGVGELFCSTNILNLLHGIDKEDPDFKVILESNGSLFNRKNWEKISNLGKYKLEVYITIHSFNEETYQFLSGTNMPISTVIDNLHFIQELREKNIINYFEIATVICERNFREMPGYVEKCLQEFNPDKIRLRYFIPYGVEDRSIEWFYDIRNPYHPYYKEFLKIMDNSVFDNPKVWKWQGNNISALGEHPYILEHKKLELIGDLFDIEDFSLKMKIWMKEEAINTCSLYGFSSICKCMIVILKHSNIPITKIYDSNIEEEREFEGICVVSPDRVALESDAIIITSVYQEEIRDKLMSLEYKGKIFNIRDMLDKIACYNQVNV